jgi:hypothetical protein
MFATGRAQPGWRSQRGRTFELTFLNIDAPAATHRTPTLVDADRSGFMVRGEPPMAARRARDGVLGLCGRRQACHLKTGHSERQTRLRCPQVRLTGAADSQHAHIRSPHLPGDDQRQSTWPAPPPPRGLFIFDRRVAFPTRGGAAGIGKRRYRELKGFPPLDITIIAGAARSVPCQLRSRRSCQGHPGDLGHRSPDCTSYAFRALSTWKRLVRSEGPRAIGAIAAEFHQVQWLGQVPLQRWRRWCHDLQAH